MVPGWRLDLSDDPLAAVQVLDGNPVQIGAAADPHTMQFYAAATGAHYGTLHTDTQLQPEDSAWQSFLETLRAPNGAYLPVADTGQYRVYSTYDGRLHLCWRRGGSLLVDMDGQRTTLPRNGDAPVVAAGLDREFGMVAVLDDAGRLHIYQQSVYVGAFALDPRPHGHPAVMLPDAAGLVLVADANWLQVVGAGGDLQRKLALPAAFGRATCSPDGSQIVISDHTTLHVYTAELTLVRQGALLEVLERAQPVQLLGGLPLPDVPPEVIAVGNDGTLVFAVTGVLCVSHVDTLPALPQPRPLF
jgi:hypothetical protein